MDSYRYTRFVWAWGWFSVLAGLITDFVWFEKGGWGEAPETYGLLAQVIPCVFIVWSMIGVVLPLLNPERSRRWVYRHLWGSLIVLGAGALVVFISRLMS